jgi:hypothetical protein
MAERKTKRSSDDASTWRELLPGGFPEPRLITRTELLSKLSADGVDVTERTLRFWEAEGVLPRPVRQSHQGIVQALYPYWYPFVVQKVYLHRQEGLSLAVIAADIPRAIQGFAMISLAYESNFLPLAGTPHGAELIEPLTEIVRLASEPDRPIRYAQITLMDGSYKSVFNLFWPVPEDHVLNGLPEESITNIQLSDGTGNHAASDMSN